MTFKEQKNLFRRLMLTAVFAVTTLVLFAQSNVISGVVTSSEDGEPLIGVSIQVKGTSGGTITDLDGHFTIKPSSDNVVLVFSMIGMKTTEVSVKNKTSLKVIMEPDTKLLEQIVVPRTGLEPVLPKGKGF